MLKDIIVWYCVVTISFEAIRLLVNRKLMFDWIMEQIDEHPSYMLHTPAVRFVAYWLFQAMTLVYAPIGVPKELFKTHRLPLVMTRECLEADKQRWLEERKRREEDDR